MPSTNSLSIPTWEEVMATSEYANDYQTVYNTMVGALANSIYIQNPSLVKLIAQITTVHRYYARHLKDFKDIDKTPFFQQLANEIGYDLPILNDYAANELLRENKRWYGSKGTTKVFPFAGDLINSPLEIDYPSLQIMEFDNPDTLLDGVVGGGATTWANSKIGHYQDGEFYWPFVYIVRVTQAQNVKNFNDLYTILDNVNPAGMKYVIFYVENWMIDMSSVPTPAMRIWSDQITDWFQVRTQYPTFDNGLTFDDPDSLYDEDASNWFMWNINFIEIQPLQEDFGYLQLRTSQLPNKSLPADINHVYATGETTLQLSATGNVVPIVFNATQHIQYVNGVDYSLDPNTTVLTWINHPNNNDTVLAKYPWVTFSRDISSPISASGTYNHTYATGETQMQLTTYGKGIASVPTITNTTQSTTLVHGTDFTLDSVNGKILWITHPNNNDAIQVNYTYFTQLWRTVFSDTDSLVHENVTTNIGMKNYTYDVWANLTYQEIQDAAWDLDQANHKEAVLQEILFFDSIT